MTLTLGICSGLPKNERHVLTVRFKLYNGSKKLEASTAIQFVTSLIDGVGSTIKLSANVRTSVD